ncbi:methyl-accepting chemotaxis protein [Marinomonas arenicola]|uniref:Methyl-accepting chemotaxis protein n=1 Tax=Marinomonas arenicola TaxID=569601 RepID=A0ABU9G9I5_9GAMM
MAPLESDKMNLSAAEKRWLPVFGSTGKLKMQWSCLLNRKSQASVESTFEGVAATRVRILTTWANTVWSRMNQVAQHQITEIDELATFLPLLKQGLPDASEVFLCDDQAGLVASTHKVRIGTKHTQIDAFERSKKGRFLHGPYPDDITLALGASTSSFHDAVTLMFYLPIVSRSNVFQGCLCVRVPNDVIGDLIQREAGHIYHESGDNYLFMVSSVFDKSIQKGVALSRSRFEDDAFFLGENLKQGVTTAFGVVTVKQHTELELKFTDPATGELHPGVRETIKNGENLYVKYPGYSDYRHIPVIGKGVTFVMPGSDDTWGMMCEADLEEVYRTRSISYSNFCLYALVMLCVCVFQYVLASFFAPNTSLYFVLSLMGGLGALVCLDRLGARRTANQLVGMTKVIKELSEGEGNLTQRMELSRLPTNEVGEMGRWINSFVDQLDSIVGEVIVSAREVNSLADEMQSFNREAFTASSQVRQAAQESLTLVNQQAEGVAVASQTAEEMKRKMQEAVQQAHKQYQGVRQSTETIRDVVQSSASSVMALNDNASNVSRFVEEIADITSQTNLLALNAAIEAARAGEHGRGFSVVADEVRALAGRTAAAAADIGKVVEGIMVQTNQAVEYMEAGVHEVNQSLVNNEVASNDSEALAKVADNMFNVIELISSNSHQHGDHTLSVAASAEQMSNCMQQLQMSSNQVKNRSADLSTLVSTFEVSVG